MNSTTNYELLGKTQVLSGAVTDDSVIEIAANPHTPDKPTCGLTIGELRKVANGGARVYRALLTQVGTNAPVAVILENSLGGAIVWTRTGVGTYLGTLAGAFTQDKTFTVNGAVGGSSFGVCYLARTGVDTVSLNTYDVDFSGPTGDTADDLLISTAVEIKIYS